MAHLYKSTRGFSVIGVVLLVVVVAIIGFTGYAMFAVNSGEDPKFTANNPAPSRRSTSTDDAAGLIAAAKESLADNITVKEVPADTDPANPKPAPEPAEAGTANVMTGTQAAYFKASEGNFYVQAEKGASLTIALHGDTAGKADGKIIARVSTGITDALGKAGLKKVVGSAYTNQWIETYKSDSTVCQTEPKDSDVNPRSLRCADLVDVNETALKVKPIVADYRAAKPDAPAALLLTNIAIKEGPVPDFKSAIIGLGTAGEMGGSAGYFYQRGGYVWKLFAQTQMTPTCASFDADPDAKAAFKGQRCLNDGRPGESTVQ